MRYIGRFIALAAVICICAGCLTLSGCAASGIYRVGDTIEDFTFTTYDGETFTLYGLLEEKDMVLINLWATWCGPCRGEFPYMQDAYELTQDDVAIVALSVEPTDTDEVLSEFAHGLGLTFCVGRDTENIAGRFGVTGIPTSVVVDRNGVICFIESGALPDVDSFTRLFGVFTGDNYSGPRLLSGLPGPAPAVEPSYEVDIGIALNSDGGRLDFTNPEDGYTWPMTVGETDGRSVVISSNTGVENSVAAVETVVSADAGDALAVTFRISSQVGCDLFNIRINGDVVKSFCGEDGWMTYAYLFEEAGEYTVTLEYENSEASTAGADTLWIDSVELLSGDAAADALAANPAYPVSDNMYIKAVSEGAREIVINDPTGKLAQYYTGPFYIINGSTATFEIGIPEGIDPELALVSFNFDGSLYSLADCIVDGRFIVTGGVDSVGTSGYCDSSVFLYPSLNSTDGAVATYFMDEENADALVNSITADENGNVLGSWEYADEQPAVREDAELTEAVYTVKYVDQNGAPVAGVMCQVCDETTCQVFVSDENGVCEFTLAPYEWEIHTLSIPEGYEGDTETVTIAPIAGGEMVFTLTSK